MTHYYTCDKCGESQKSMMAYELLQLTDEEDSDGDQRVVAYHLCSSKCLCEFAMDLAMDFADVDQPDPPDT